MKNLNIKETIEHSLIDKEIDYGNIQDRIEITKLLHKDKAKYIYPVSNLWSKVGRVIGYLAYIVIILYIILI
jgi:hypothetical protein